MISQVKHINLFPQRKVKGVLIKLGHRMKIKNTFLRLQYLFEI